MRNIFKNSYEVHSSRVMGTNHHVHICTRPFMTKSAFIAEIKRKLDMAEYNGVIIANVMYHGKLIDII